MTGKSTGTSRPSKSAKVRPDKPYATFPLSAHAGGKWVKKIKGEFHYYGRWGKVVNGTMQRIPGDGWKEALERYKAEADDLHAGRIPRVDGKTVTVKDVCNKFLNAKLDRLNNAEISPRTFTEYKATATRLVKRFGGRYVDDLNADDFQSLRNELAKQYGPVRLGNEIVRVKTVFKYGFDMGLIDKPLRYGTQFVRPSKTVLRKHRAANGKKLFTGKAVRELIDAAGVPLKAMILLGINCGFGNADCANLPLSAVDLEAGWVTFPRPKTGIARRAKLWPETVEALRAAIESRPTPKDNADADILFITRLRHRWVRTRVEQPTKEELEKAPDRTPKHTPIDSVGLEFRKVAKSIAPGLGFYAIRHTFRTVADATKDFPACRMIMGHADGGIDDFYIEGIDDARLIAVSEYVRAWLPASSPLGEKEGGAE